MKTQNNISKNRKKKKEKKKESIKEVTKSINLNRIEWLKIIHMIGFD